MINYNNQIVNKYEKLQDKKNSPGRRGSTINDEQYLQRFQQRQ